MNSNRLKSMSLVAALAGSIAVGVAACSGGGGGSSSTPTPSPTANPANECDLIFVSPAATTGKLHAYVFNMPATEWSNGAKTLAVNSGDPSVDAIYEYFLYNYQSGQTPGAAGLATSGTITLGGIPATNPLAGGATFTFSDPGAKKYFAEFTGGNGMQNASNGAGSISAGVLSDPAAFDAGSTVNVTPYDGQVVVNVNTMAVTTTLTIGGTGNAYGACYFYMPFAPETRQQHMMNLVDAVIRNRN